MAANDPRYLPPALWMHKQTGEMVRATLLGQKTVSRVEGTTGTRFMDLMKRQDFEEQYEFVRRLTLAECEKEGAA